MTAPGQADRRREPKGKLGLSADAPLPVSRAIGRVREIVRDEVRGRFWYSGEVSDLREGSSGMGWFSLQDNGWRISCVVLAKAGEPGAAALQDGMRVIVYAQLNVYERNAGVQLLVSQFRLDGAGEAKRRRAEVRERLAREGLLDSRRKRALPAYPRSVAVITSDRGAVVHDIAEVARRRHPGVQLWLIPTPVQGAHAAEGVIRSLALAERAGCQVIILARGGGSRAELEETFEHEEMARAIAASRVPVVVAIGHETDRLLAEEVADLRAATPSIAAERVIPDRRQLAASLAQLSHRARRALEHRLRRADARLSAARASVSLAHATLHRHRARVDRLHANVNRQLTARMHRSKSVLTRRHADLIDRLTKRARCERARVDRLTALLAALDPRAVLDRGFAILSDEQGRVVSSIAEAQRKRRLRIRMHDGDFIVNVPLKHRTSREDQHAPNV